MTEGFINFHHKISRIRDVINSRICIRHLETEKSFSILKYRDSYISRSRKPRPFLPLPAIFLNIFLIFRPVSISLEPPISSSYATFSFCFSSSFCRFFHTKQFKNSRKRKDEAFPSVHSVLFQLDLEQLVFLHKKGFLQLFGRVLIFFLF